MFSDDLTIKEIFYQVLCAGGVVVCFALFTRRLRKKEKYRQLIDIFGEKLYKAVAIIFIIGIAIHLLTTIALFLFSIH